MYVIHWEEGIASQKPKMYEHNPDAFEGVILRSPTGGGLGPKP